MFDVLKAHLYLDIIRADNSYGLSVLVVSLTNRNYFVSQVDTMSYTRPCYI